MKIVDDVMDEKLLDKKIEIAKINKVRNLKLQAMRDCIVKKVGVLGKWKSLFQMVLELLLNNNMDYAFMIIQLMHIYIYVKKISLYRI